VRQRPGTAEEWTSAARRGVTAIDGSPLHDWSSVCVWNKKFHFFGHVYSTAGFIYPAR